MRSDLVHSPLDREIAQDNRYSGLSRFERAPPQRLVKASRSARGQITEILKKLKSPTFFPRTDRNAPRAASSAL